MVSVWSASTPVRGRHADYPRVVLQASVLRALQAPTPKAGVGSSYLPKRTGGRRARARISRSRRESVRPSRAPSRRRAPLRGEEAPCRRGGARPGPCWLPFVAGPLLLWLVLLLMLWRAAPDRTRLCDVLRLLPHLVRLVNRLAEDGSLPRGVRVRLVLLLA